MVNSCSFILISCNSFTFCTEIIIGNSHCLNFVSMPHLRIPRHHLGRRLLLLQHQQLFELHRAAPGDPGARDLQRPRALLQSFGEDQLGDLSRALRKALKPRRAALVALQELRRGAAHLHAPLLRSVAAPRRQEGGCQTGCKTTKERAEKRRNTGENRAKRHEKTMNGPISRPSSASEGPGHLALSQQKVFAASRMGR